MRKAGLYLTLFTWLLMLGYVIWLYPQMPEMIPMKFSELSTTNRYEPRWDVARLVLTWPVLYCIAAYVASDYKPVMTWTSWLWVLSTLLITHAYGQMLLPKPIWPVPVPIALSIAMAIPVFCVWALFHVLAKIQRGELRRESERATQNDGVP